MASLTIPDGKPETTIAERVAGLIAASGLGQRAIAEQMRIDEFRLAAALAGTRRFTSLDLARIGDRFDVTVDWLLTGKDPWGDLRINLCWMPAEASPATASAETDRGAQPQPRDGESP